MTAFFEYLRNITYYLLFATLVGMAVPSGKYKKYVTLITGLVLLLLMVSPLKNLSGGVPVTEWFSQTVSTVPVLAGQPEPALPGGELSQAQLGAAFEEQLFIQVAALLEKDGYILDGAEFEYERDFSRITGMNLQVTVPAEGVKKPSRPLIRIEPVTIGQTEPPDESPEDENAARIKKLVTDFYAPDTPHINVTTYETNE